MEWDILPLHWIGPYRPQFLQITFVNKGILLVLETLHECSIWIVFLFWILRLVLGKLRMVVTFFMFFATSAPRRIVRLIFLLYLLSFLRIRELLEEDSHFFFVCSLTKNWSILLISLMDSYYLWMIFLCSSILLKNSFEFPCAMYVEAISFKNELEVWDSATTEFVLSLNLGKFQLASGSPRAL